MGLRRKKDDTNLSPARRAAKDTADERTRPRGKRKSADDEERREHEAGTESPAEVEAQAIADETTAPRDHDQMVEDEKRRVVETTAGQAEAVQIAKAERVKHVEADQAQTRDSSVDFDPNADPFRG